MFYPNCYGMWSLFLLVMGLLHFLLGLYFLLMDSVVFVDWEVFMLNSVTFTMTCLFDWMSVIFMSVVLLISSMVILYSKFYMSDDVNKIRFLLLVLMFVLSMIFLIVSPNLISILLGWDGLGLVSYCLVIYFQNYNSYNAGMLTMLTNRLGDVAILISIAWIFSSGGFNFVIYFPMYGLNQYMVYLMIIAAFTKSAQIPFSSWLPAAMAAPTPVSALVHSSTLVTAGVYLLIRFESYLFNLNMNLLLLLSCLTMFMSGLCANFEYDLKKIIALSTLSQLGFMMTILFMGNYYLSYFHLLTHAFFKALLFLCAGLIIHCMNDTQDIRYMGYVINQLPFSSSCYCISTLSLCGFPFLSGFYSKDLILEYMSLNEFSLFIYLLFYVSVGLTVSYSFRLIYYLFGDYNGLSPISLTGENFFMMLSMMFLTFMAVFSGSMLSWLILPFVDLFMIPLECKLLSLFMIFLGSLLGYFISQLFLGDYILGLSLSLPVYFMGSMWFMPSFSTYMTYSHSLLLSKSYMNFMDYGWGEYLISSSFTSFFNWLSSFNSVYDNNNISIYLISFLFLSLLLFMFI
uniref:NADH-ubiquinone oxidoreductase chain 5 n=1 Tax=Cyclopelta parva TaxID=696241 RepID=A0A343W8V8_9HEMI|nr:NADH dehydrogenase subunit 5 [Cyclopelta parva]AVZ00798.1 NADH dehydrogenase subunit 5 [Cyclopelta parva]